MLSQLCLLLVSMFGGTTNPETGSPIERSITDFLPNWASYSLKNIDIRNNPEEKEKEEQKEIENIANKVKNFFGITEEKTKM